MLSLTFVVVILHRIDPRRGSMYYLPCTCTIRCLPGHDRAGRKRVITALFRSGERPLVEEFASLQALFYWKSKCGGEADVLVGSQFGTPVEVKCQAEVTRDVAALTRSFLRGVMTRQTLDLSDRMLPRILVAPALWVLAREAAVAKVGWRLKLREKEGACGIKSENQPGFFIVVCVHNRWESLPRRLNPSCSLQGTIALPTNGNQQLTGTKRISGFLQPLILSQESPRQYLDPVEKPIEAYLSIWVALERPECGNEGLAELRCRTMVPVFPPGEHIISVDPIEPLLHPRFVQEAPVGLTQHIERPDDQPRIVHSLTVRRLAEYVHRRQRSSPSPVHASEPLHKCLQGCRVTIEGV